MQEKKRVSLKGILIFTIIIGGPGSLFFVLSKCEHRYEELPVVGEQVVEKDGKLDTVPFVVPNMTFKTLDGQTVRSHDLHKEITVFIPTRGTCPTLEECNVTMEHIEFEMYKKVNESSKLNPMVRIVSVIPDTDSVTNDLKLFFDGVDTSVWTVVRGDMLPLYSFLDDGEVFHHSKRLVEENMTWENLVVVVDKYNQVRAVMPAKRTGEVRETMDRMRLLKKEYDKDKK